MLDRAAPGEVGEPRGGRGDREGGTGADWRGGSSLGPRGPPLAWSSGAPAEGHGGLGVCPKYLEPGARLLPGRQGSVRSLRWDIWGGGWAGLGPGLGALGVGSGFGRTALGPPWHPGDRRGWPATGGPSVLKAKGGAGSGCPAGEEPLGEGEPTSI